MSTEVISINLSVNPDFVSVLRLTASGIASKMGFSIDEIEDIKVSISEACTNSIKHSKKDEFQVKFYIYKNKLEIEVRDKGIGCDLNKFLEPDLKNPKTSGLGLFIIKSLMDNVEINTYKESGFSIKMTKVVGAEI